MGQTNGPSPIVTNGSIICIDPANFFSILPNNELKDLSKRNNNSVFLNGITLSSSTLVLDGVDDSQKISKNSSFSSLVTFTADIWFKFDEFSGNPPTTVCLMANTDIGGNGFGIIAARTAVLPYRLYPRFALHNFINTSLNFLDLDLYNSLFEYNYTTLIGKNKWKNLVMTANNGTYNCWVNGIKSSTTNTNATAPFQKNSTDLYYGSRPNGQQPFLGRMSQIKMYNRVLSDDEILQNFNSLRARFGI
jgi:hypothetical protein